MNQMIALCREFPFWDKMTETEHELWTSQTYIETHAKGSMIYNSEDECKGMIRVISGVCRVYMVSEEGRQITLFSLTPGDVCTLSASCVLDEIVFEVSMTAEEDCELLVTRSGVLNRLKEQNVYLDNYIYRKTVEKFSDVMWTMQQILFERFDKRLAAFLIDEMQSNGNPIRMTHDSVAAYLGSAREVVSRMLKYFEKERLVKLSRGMIEIADKDGLKKLIR